MTLIIIRLKYLFIILCLLDSFTRAMDMQPEASSLMIASVQSNKDRIAIHFKDYNDKKRNLTNDEAKKLKKISRAISDMPKGSTIPIYSLSAADFQQFSQFIDPVYQLKIAPTDDKDTIKKQIGECIHNLSLPEQLQVFKVSDYLIVPLLNDIVIKNIAQNIQTPQQLKFFVNNHKEWQKQYQGVTRHYYLQQSIAQEILCKYYPILLESFKVPSCIIDTFADINSVSWSPDGAMIASGACDNRIRIWSNVTHDTSIIRGNNWPMRSVSWSHNGEKLAVALWDTVCIWHMNGNLLHVLSGEASGLINSVAWSSDDKKIVSGSEDHTAHVWDCITGEELQIINASSPINSVAWSPDGTRIAIAAADGVISIWDSFTSRLMRILTNHTKSVCSVAWSPDGSMLASGSEDKTICVWNCAFWRLINTLNYKDTIHSVAWSHNGIYLAGGSQDGAVCIWDIITGQLLKILIGHKDRVKSVIWSPNEQEIASGSRDKTIRIWNMAPLHSFIHTILKNLDLEQSLFATLAFSGYAWINNNDMIAIFDTLPESVKDSILNNSLLIRYMLPLIRIKNYYTKDNSNHF